MRPKNTIWLGVGLFVAMLTTAGLGCGPKEKFCWEEGRRCSDLIVEPPPHGGDAGADASDQDRVRICFDNSGIQIPCP